MRTGRPISTIDVKQVGAYSCCKEEQYPGAVSARIPYHSPRVKRSTWPCLLPYKRHLGDEDSFHSEENPIELRCDNQSTICIARSGGYTPRTKQIDIRHHYIRDALDRKITKINYVKTEEQVADELTKPLQRVKLECNEKRWDWSVEDQ